MSKSKEIIDAELDATQLLGRWSNFRFFGNRQAARYRRVRILPPWVERIRTRKCRTQSGPLKCRRNLAQCSEHLVTRDFSRESCQPLTRHCELRCVPGT
jgi:hypothetical protein